MPAAEVYELGQRFLAKRPGLLQAGGNLRFATVFRKRHPHVRIKDEHLDKVWQAALDALLGGLRTDAGVVLAIAMRKTDDVADRRVAVRAAKVALDHMPAAASREQATHYDEEVQGWREPAELTEAQQKERAKIEEYLEAREAD